MAIHITVNLPYQVTAELDAPVPYSSHLWTNAIQRVLRHPNVKNGSEFDTLPIPSGCADGFTLHQDGIPIRCVSAYVPFPTDGGPPGFRSRVDVLIIR